MCVCVCGAGVTTHPSPPNRTHTHTHTYTHTHTHMNTCACVKTQELVLPDWITGSTLASRGRAGVFGDVVINDTVASSSDDTPMAHAQLPFTQTFVFGGERKEHVYINPSEYV